MAPSIDFQKIWTGPGLSFKNFNLCPAQIFGFVFLLFALTLTPAIRADDELDHAVAVAMNKHQIPGLSLAIVDDWKIVRAQAWGFADKTERSLVTTQTLFQAGSVSKAVSAFAVLHLVEAGKLS